MLDVAVEGVVGVEEEEEETAVEVDREFEALKIYHVIQRLDDSECKKSNRLTGW